MTFYDLFGLKDFNIPEKLVRPAVEVFRLVNGAVDGIFYDVPGLVHALSERDRLVTTQQGSQPPSRVIDLDALRDPEGCLLLVNPTLDPFIRRFQDVTEFLGAPLDDAWQTDVVTITGVGSSALGSAALAWNIAVALGKPVLAIVPGYGLADIIQQALGGWFGFGLHDWLNSKQAIQGSLAAIAPASARIGRRLAATAPDAPMQNDAPVFRYGSGSSDVLHALIEHRAAPFRLLVGHSKGALQIGNAIRSLPGDRIEGLAVVTLGCPIAEDASGVTYHQFLGLLDSLGQLNAWGHWPEFWVWSWHTTNPLLPPAMDTRAAVR